MPPRKRHIRTTAQQGSNHEDDDDDDTSEQRPPPKKQKCCSNTIKNKKEEDNDRRWEAKFAQLLRYKHRFGDVRIPSRWTENPKLSTWVAGQRRLYKRQRLPQDRLDRLNQVGFIWRPRQEAENVLWTWDERFEELKQYKAQHGTTNVSECRITENNHLQLSRWVGAQRTAFRKKDWHYLTQERRDKLNAIDFIWDPIESTWERHLQELVEYKQEHDGDTNVPSRYKPNRTLSWWTEHQRRRFEANQLAQDKIDKLNAIGFLWQRTDQVYPKWETRFETLRQFQQKHWNCRIPHKCKRLASLYVWCRRQRRLRRRNKLKQERIDKLSSIGFPWEIPQEECGFQIGWRSKRAKAQRQRQCDEWSSSSSDEEEDDDDDEEEEKEVEDDDDREEEKEETNK